MAARRGVCKSDHRLTSLEPSLDLRSNSRIVDVRPAQLLVLLLACPSDALPGWSPHDVLHRLRRSDLDGGDFIGANLRRNRRSPIQEFESAGRCVTFSGFGRKVLGQDISWIDIPKDLQVLNHLGPRGLLHPECARIDVAEFPEALPVDDAQGGAGVGI